MPSSLSRVARVNDGKEWNVFVLCLASGWRVCNVYILHQTKSQCECRWWRTPDQKYYKSFFFSSVSPGAATAVVYRGKHFIIITVTVTTIIPLAMLCTSRHSVLFPCFCAREFIPDFLVFSLLFFLMLFCLCFGICERSRVFIRCETWDKICSIFRFPSCRSRNWQQQREKCIFCRLNAVFFFSCRRWCAFARITISRYTTFYSLLYFYWHRMT